MVKYTKAEEEREQIKDRQQLKQYAIVNIFLINISKKKNRSPKRRKMPITYNGGFIENFVLNRKTIFLLGFHHLKYI